MDLLVSFQFVELSGSFNARYHSFYCVKMVRIPLSYVCNSLCPMKVT
jgi:hypothetical protein